MIRSRQLLPASARLAHRRSRAEAAGLGVVLSFAVGLLGPPAAMATITVEAHYRLGEAGLGTNRRPLDSSGNGRHFQADANGGSVVVDGSNPASGSASNYVFAGTNQGFSTVGWDPPEDNVGVECWARAGTLTQTAQVFGTGRLSYGNGINLVYRSGGFQANLGGAGYDTWVGVPYLPASTSEWVHLAVVRDNGKTRFYVNGLQAGVYSTTAPSASTQPFLGAGHNFGQKFFNGAIDEARMFTFAPGQFDPVTDLLFDNTPFSGLFPTQHPQPYFIQPVSHPFYGGALDFVGMSGWQALWTRYRGFLPTGAGVTVAQVESGVPTAANYPDKTIVIAPAGTVPDSSGHADTVASILYASAFYEDTQAVFENGFSRGIAQIGSFTTGAFRTDVLKINNNVRLPGLPGWGATRRDVLNISNTLGYGGEANTIRALDYLIDQENVLACTSFPGSGTYNETLSGTLWNSVVVDKNGPETKAWYGAKQENQDGLFRFKPDLVTASYMGRTGGASSWATPTVSSGAAFLLERARATANTADATRNYVLKAILMAGAGKANLVSPVWTNGEITAWDYATPYVWTNSPPAMPLDRLFGAGLFNLDHAYAILNASGASTAITNVPVGWARGTGLAAGRTDRYRFVVAKPETEFSAMLAWNRHIQESGTTAYQWTVADLRLELKDASGQVLAASDAAGNNVEHIYLPAGLAPGSYWLEVSSHTAAPDDYGLAWRTADNVSQVLPPYDQWANASGLTPSNNERTLDPDQDGAVNLLEFALGGDPLTGAEPGRIHAARPELTGGPALTVTLSARLGAAFGPASANAMEAACDGISYRVEASSDLLEWDERVTEITPAITAGLPPVPPGCAYHTFQAFAPATAKAAGFIRCKVTSLAPP